jgi:hypothetical protein
MLKGLLIVTFLVRIIITGLYMEKWQELANSVDRKLNKIRWQQGYSFIHLFIHSFTCSLSSDRSVTSS